MLCPKCNCENVKIHREKIGNVSGNKGVYAKKKHGILYLDICRLVDLDSAYIF
jgi:hypothetical protein